MNTFVERTCDSTHFELVGHDLALVIVGEKKGNVKLIEMLSYLVIYISFISLSSEPDSNLDDLS